MKRKLRVLQIYHDYEGPFGTIARQYAIAFADCDVTTIFLRGYVSEDITRDVPGQIHFLDLKQGELRGLRVKPAKLVRQLIEDVPPDIIIAHRYKPLSIAVALNYSITIPLIIGVMHEFGFLKRFTRSLFARFWPSNVHLVGVSEPVTQEIAESSPYLEGRLHVVPHGLERTYGLDSVTARHELGIPLGVFCYGSVGRLVRKKNFELLIDAFSRLGDDSVLAIIGSGEQEAELKAKVKSSGLGDRVIFCGFKVDAKRYLKAFDVFVLPSSDKEAFGMVLLEAMQAGISIVCSDAPGPKSVVADCAELFTCDEVASLRDSLGKLKSLSREEINALTDRAAKRLDSEYSVAAMTHKLRNLPPVKELIGRHG